MKGWAESEDGRGGVLRGMVGDREMARARARERDTASEKASASEREIERERARERERERKSRQRPGGRARGRERGRAGVGAKPRVNEPARASHVSRGPTHVLPRVRPAPKVDVFSTTNQVRQLTKSPSAPRGPPERDARPTAAQSIMI